MSDTPMRRASDQEPWPLRRSSDRQQPVLTTPARTSVQLFRVLLAQTVPGVVGGKQPYMLYDFEIATFSEALVRECIGLANTFEQYELAEAIAARFALK